MEVTESQLATALEGFYVRVRAPIGDEPVTAQLYDADGFAAVLHATLSRMAALREPHPKCTDRGCSYCNPGEGVVDAHICCEHAGTRDREVLAMAAVLQALAPLRPDECSRVLDWARRRFAAEPPF